MKTILRAGMVGILLAMMGFFLVGCGEQDFSEIDSNEFYAVPESRGPSELPNVVGPSASPPRE